MSNIDDIVMAMCEPLLANAAKFIRIQHQPDHSKNATEESLGSEILRFYIFISTSIEVKTNKYSFHFTSSSSPLIARNCLFVAINELFYHLFRTIAVEPLKIISFLFHRLPSKMRVIYDFEISVWERVDRKMRRIEVE